MNSNQTAEREEEKISSVGYLIPLQAHEDMILEMNTLKHENAILANCLSKIDLQPKCSEGIQTDLEAHLKSEGTAELLCLKAIVMFSKELEAAERKVSESSLREEKHPLFENFMKNPKRNQNEEERVSENTMDRLGDSRRPPEVPTETISSMILWTSVRSAGMRYLIQKAVLKIAIRILNCLLILIVVEIA
jgi:hypothetical protein